MGISAGTALSEALIDSSKDDAQANQVQALTAEQQTLEQTISGLQAQIDNLNAVAAPTPTDLANRDGLGKQVQDDRTRWPRSMSSFRLLARRARRKSRSFLRTF